MQTTENTRKTYTDKDIREENMQVDLDQLSADICISPEKLDAFGKQWMNGWHNYSLYNTLLIWYQLPSATLVGGLKKMNKLGRKLKPKENMLWIWAPKMIYVKDKDTGEKESRCIGFKAVPVCAIEQTEGKPLDMSKFGGSEYITGNSDIDIIKVGKALGIDVNMAKWLGGANGKIEHGTDLVTLMEKDNGSAVIATGFHEYGHKLLGHTSDKKETPRHIKEIQAEAVSYLVCRCFGIENEKSKYYIANWKGTATEIAKYGHDMIKVASKIVKAVETTLN